MIIYLKNKQGNHMGKGKETSWEGGKSVFWAFQLILGNFHQN